MEGRGQRNGDETALVGRARLDLLTRCSRGSRGGQIEQTDRRIEIDADSRARSDV